MLKSPICALFGIEHPILLAGMGGASTPELAAAVSNAGGLGIMGAAGLGPGQLREWIARCRALTDKPFGVDTLLPASVRRGANRGWPSNRPSPRDLVPEYRERARAFLAEEGIPEAPAAAVWPQDDGPPLFSKAFFEAQMEVVIEEAVPVYASGLGSPAAWLDRLRDKGTKVLAVIGTVRHARQLLPVGLDALVAQGHDGGGHNSPIGTMALIPQVVDAVEGKVPVLGAGGITDGRGVAAAMMLGADGAWVGSAFLASAEAGIEPGQKQAIVDATEEGTTVSRSVTGKPARIIRSKWTELWANDPEREPLPMPYQGQVSRPVMVAANLAGRADVNPGYRRPGHRHDPRRAPGRRHHGGAGLGRRGRAPRPQRRLPGGLSGPWNSGCSSNSGSATGGRRTTSSARASSWRTLPSASACTRSGWRSSTSCRTARCSPRPLRWRPRSPRARSALRIGMAVYVLPLAHPLRIAEEVATVDQISGGRFDFGIGRSGFIAQYQRLRHRLWREPGALRRGAGSAARRLRRRAVLL